jgi:hypothetical protein
MQEMTDCFPYKASIIASEGLANLGKYLALLAFEQ